MEELSCRVKTTSCQPLSFHWSKSAAVSVFTVDSLPSSHLLQLSWGGEVKHFQTGWETRCVHQVLALPRGQGSTSSTGCKASIGSFQCGVERLSPRDLCVDSSFHFNLNWTQHHFSSSTTLIYICLHLLIHETRLCLIHEERKTLKKLCLSSNSSR